MRNAFTNKTLADTKFSKVQWPKIIQLAGFLGALLGKFAGPLMRVAVPLAKNVLVALATITSASAIDSAIQRKFHGRGVVKAGKGIT